MPILRARRIVLALCLIRIGSGNPHHPLPLRVAAAVIAKHVRRVFLLKSLKGNTAVPRDQRCARSI